MSQFDKLGFRQRDRKGEARTLGNMGNSTQSREFYNQSLSMLSQN